MTVLLLLGVASAEDPEGAALSAARRLKARPVAAWIYGGEAQSSPPPGKQYVGAELALRRFDPAVELSDVEAVNPATRAAYGNPQYACVDPEGAWMDCDQASGAVNVRLVWTVSDTAEALRFTLYGRKLARRVMIDPDGPQLPRRAR